MTTATIRLVLERDFESFGVDQRHLLIDDIANLLGCNTDELKNVRFRRGCVILEFEVHEEIAEWFVRLAKKAETGADLTEELEAIKECFKRHGIAGVNIERKVRFAIERRDNTPQREIALIHGWNGSSESFGQLPKILKSKFNCEVYVYPYPSGTKSGSPGLYFVAKNLRNALLNNTSGKTLAVIAHSMGGVILRRMLANQLLEPDQIGERLRLAIFAASPRNGAALADLGSYVPFLPKEQLQDLSPNSGFIVALNEEWRKWVEQKVPNLCAVKAIYGTADKVVPCANAADYEGEAVPLYADHTGIVKPEDENSEIVKTLIRFMMGFGEQ